MDPIPEAESNVFEIPTELAALNAFCKEQGFDVVKAQLEPEVVLLLDKLAEVLGQREELLAQQEELQTEMIHNTRVNQVLQVYKEKLEKEVEDCEKYHEELKEENKKLENQFQECLSRRAHQTCKQAAQWL